MKLRWIILGGLALAAIIGGTYVYQNRVDILLDRVAKRGKPDIAPNIETVSYTHLTLPTIYSV